VMAAHMVSIARREYESDWTWRSSAAKPSLATSEQVAEAPQLAADGRVGLRSSQAGGSSGAAGAATAVLEAAPPGVNPSFDPSSSGRAAPAAPASGDPVEPKRVLYSYYTVRLYFWRNEATTCMHGTIWHARRCSCYQYCWFTFV